MKAVIYSKQIPGTRGIENTIDKYEVFESHDDAVKRYKEVKDQPTTSMAALTNIEYATEPHWEDQGTENSFLTKGGGTTA